jgi:hypothetical protein
MMIKYSDGRRSEGLFLVKGDTAMRVATNGVEDAVDFSPMTATWVSETCFEHARQQAHLKKPVAEADCICSKERAAWLIQLLFGGSEITHDVMPVVQPLNDCWVGWVV